MSLKTWESKYMTCMPFLPILDPWQTVLIGHSTFPHGASEPFLTPYSRQTPLMDQSRCWKRTRFANPGTLNHSGQVNTPLLTRYNEYKHGTHHLKCENSRMDTFTVLHIQELIHEHLAVCETPWWALGWGAHQGALAQAPAAFERRS